MSNDARRTDKQQPRTSTNDTAKHRLDRRSLLLGSTTIAAASALGSPTQLAQAQQQPAPTPGRRPNILVIFGDDIGQTNFSAYSFGLMGYRTPNIDRIAREGMMFTDYYAEQSCTAGRSSFITGQATLRTGLSKVGIPGATVGSITSMRKKTRSRVPIRATLRSGEPSVRAAFCAARRPIATIRPSSHAGERWANRLSRTPARSPRSGWRRSTTKRRLPPSISCGVRFERTRRSSAGSTLPACTSARMCGKLIATNPD
jgi:hypothetical protein